MSKQKTTRCPQCGCLATVTTASGVCLGCDIERQRRLYRHRTVETPDSQDAAGDAPGGHSGTARGRSDCGTPSPHDHVTRARIVPQN